MFVQQKFQRYEENCKWHGEKRNCMHFYRSSHICPILNHHLHSNIGIRTFDVSRDPITPNFACEVDVSFTKISTLRRKYEKVHGEKRNCMQFRCSSHICPIHNCHLQSYMGNLTFWSKFDAIKQKFALRADVCFTKISTLRRKCENGTERSAIARNFVTCLLQNMIFKRTW